jgi:hypothetical protein
MLEKATPVKNGLQGKGGPLLGLLLLLLQEAHWA